MHVIISDDALEDLRDIWDFVSRSSVDSADTLVDQLVDRALGLAENHQIFDRVLPSHVDVMRIVHGGMRMETLFGR